jgi:hypothetical protein
MILSGDTSGAITVTVPAVAGTNTITLPAATGTVQVSGNMPSFAANPSNNQGLALGTWTKVVLDVEQFDTNNNFASNRFTPTVAGYYQINAVLQFFASSGLTVNAAAIYKNGSINAYTNFISSSAFGSASVSSIIQMNGTTDYIEFYAYILAGSSVGVSSGASTVCSGSLVRNA